MEDEQQARNNVDVEKDEVIKFWNTMWNDDLLDNSDKYKEFLNEYISEATQKQDGFLSERTFYEIISYLPNWKSAGPEGIYNFFIKWMSALHKCLYEIIMEIFLKTLHKNNGFTQGVHF